MRFLFSWLGLIAAATALILSVTPFSQSAFFPAIAAFAFGGIVYYRANRERVFNKSMPLIFLLSGIAIILSTYKLIFHPEGAKPLENTKGIDVEGNDVVPEDLDLNLDTTERDTIKFEDFRDVEDLEDQ